MKTEVNVDRFPLTNAKKQAISIEIEKIKNSCPELTYFESIIIWCDTNDFDLSDFKKCMNDTLFRKVELECKNANLIKDEKSSKCEKNGERLLGI